MNPLTSHWEMAEAVFTSILFTSRDLQIIAPPIRIDPFPVKRTKAPRQIESCSFQDRRRSGGTVTANQKYNVPNQAVINYYRLTETIH